MSAWTVEQVMALAPDAASASAGQGLASARKWASFGRSERAAWGLCQGSGKDPYQTRIDLSEPAFKCSCPSRKFPCKHGLGLMLMLAKEPGAFKQQEEPGWVAEWLAGRTERAEKKVERAKEAAEKPVDAAAQAKRAAQRETRVSDGVAGCRVWLDDLVRRGLAAAQSESAATWDRMAARMVDAQTPGLAALVRRVPELIASGADWDVRTLDHLGKVHLLLSAWDRIAELPADLAGDVRTALGWVQSKEEALAASGVSDRWIVQAQIVEEEERLRVRRTWLSGRQAGHRALILDFAAGAAPMDQSLVTGTEFDAEIAFYPSRSPLRALVKSRGESTPVDAARAPGLDLTIEDGLKSYATALAANPWIARWPLSLANVRLVRERGNWFLVDSQNAALPLKASFAASLQLWRLLSASGGGAMNVWAEWDGEWALPLSAVHNSFHYDVAPRWAA